MLWKLINQCCSRVSGQRCRVRSGGSQLLHPGYMAVGCCESQWFGFGMGGLGRGVGMCSSRYGGLGNVAGFRYLGL